MRACVCLPGRGQREEKMVMVGLPCARLRGICSSFHMKGGVCRMTFCLEALFSLVSNQHLITSVRIMQRFNS